MLAYAQSKLSSSMMETSVEDAMLCQLTIVGEWPFQGEINHDL